MIEEREEVALPYPSKTGKAQARRKTVYNSNFSFETERSSLKDFEFACAVLEPVDAESLSPVRAIG
jgi:hypothetical protein